MAKKKTGTAVANIDEELAALARKGAALTDSGGGGRFFSTSAGVLQFDDVPLPGNQMAVIIGAWCLENVYYKEAYDSDHRTPPTCFAFCKDPDLKKEFGPNPEHLEDDVFEQQDDVCEDCWANEWASAERGRGKACSNRRRLAVLPAGTYDKDGDLTLEEHPEHYKTCEEAFLKLPVTSGKGFDAYVREVEAQAEAPIFCAFTRIYLTPDPKSQFKVNFELIDIIEDTEFRSVLLERHKKLHEEIDFPYTPFEEEEAEAPKKAAANKKLTKGRSRKKK